MLDPTIMIDGLVLERLIPGQMRVHRTTCTSYLYLIISAPTVQLNVISENVFCIVWNHQVPGQIGFDWFDSDTMIRHTKIIT